ncbi:DUF2087 domain-containing protein [Streptomyces sp. NBC_00249]|uniref:DUF2087 domain-containing protein n=1 Tax=Streptomyces sp. NBC_00249 TaxID=2975690 RepID=UPI0022570071|nr:DUF2087 domain-containing protein [Streptomyces sp. NBC_00249]MCX5192819.1 DUF2087 domain-containing protein [Streptomyces sp. NBC_00249]
MTPDEFTLVLSDPALRRVFAAVALGSATSSEILAAAGLDTPVAAKAIGQLTRNGLLVPEGRSRLVLSEGVLGAVAETAARRRDEEAAAEQPDARLRGFVRDRVLVALPEEADHEARRGVLRHVGEATFTPGEEYGERAVTERLEPWCESGVLDAVSLRRALVDAGVLRRGSGLYGLTAASSSASCDVEPSTPSHSRS